MKTVISLPAALLFIIFASLILSGLSPYDLTTWLMEVAPVMVALVICPLTYRRFRLTDFLYVWIALHCVILMVGGHYSYARVPLFDEVGALLGTHRNGYDGLGHLAQGFVPALIARELLIRKAGVTSAGWLAAIIILSCLGISALYEVIEWLAALGLGQGADEFLGTQGDPWDTQKDMALAGLGATFALLTCSRFHDIALEKLRENYPAA